MPYDGVDDPNLPSNVKKMGKKARKQWVEIFNSVMEEHHDESKAFRMANGVMKKRNKAYMDSYMIYDKQVSQDNATYNALGATNEKGCANCNWFVSPDGCIIVQGAISPTGMSKFWLEKQVWKPDPMEVVVVDEKDDDDEEDDEDDETLLDKIKSLLGFKEKWTKKYINDLPDRAFFYIEPGGEKDDEGKTKPRKLRHFPYEDAEGNIDYDHVRNAIARAPQSKVPTDIQESVQSRARKLLEKEKSAANDDNISSAKPAVQSRQEIIFIKQKDDRLRFFTAFSNNFKDAQGETITEEAHREYINWAIDNKSFPELWLWHSGRKSKWGSVDWLDLASGITCASGLVDQDKEYIAEKLQKEDVSVSHGFYALMLPGDKSIYRYRSFEISPLPTWASANKWTNFTTNIEDLKMPFSEKRKTWLKEISGLNEDQIKTWEADVDQLSSKLKELGIEFKDNEQADNTNHIQELTKAVVELTTRVKSLTEAQETYTKNLDERVTQIFTAEVAKLPNGFKASEDTNNIVPQEKVKEVQNRDWFGEVISKSLT